MGEGRGVRGERCCSLRDFPSSIFYLRSSDFGHPSPLPADAVRQASSSFCLLISVFLASAFCLPTSNIRHPTSDFRLPSSALCCSIFSFSPVSPYEGKNQYQNYRDKGIEQLPLYPLGLHAFGIHFAQFYFARTYRNQA